jgi:hypothetical protein
MDKSILLAFLDDFYWLFIQKFIQTFKKKFCNIFLTQFQLHLHKSQKLLSANTYIK